MSGAGSQLRFRGALALPDDREPSLIVDLRLDDEVVVIMQDNEQIGAWNVAEVDAERLNGQKFRLQLGEDEVIFHARDRLGFAYTGISALESAKQRQVEKQQRWWFERLVSDDADDLSLGEVLTRAGEWLGELTARAKEWFEGVRADRGPGRHELTVTTTAETPLAEHQQPASTQPSVTTALEEPTIAGSREPTEPWGLEDRPMPEAPISRSRGNSRARHQRPDPLDDDPWAFVADVVLRRDETPAAPDQTPKTTKRRGRRDHVHEFEETRLPGGLVRRVCSCGEVVIRSVD